MDYKVFNTLPNKHETSNADARNLASKQIELFAHPAHNIVTPYDVTPYDSLRISFSSSVSKFFSGGRGNRLCTGLTSALLSRVT